MPEPSYVLRLTRASQPATELEFDQPRLTIGREGADLSLHDPGRSGKHAEIDFADGMVQLRDVGSTNGTWRGTTRITEQYMAPGVAFPLGGSAIELVTVNGAAVERGRTLVMPPPPGTAPGRDAALPAGARGPARQRTRFAILVGLAATILTTTMRLRSGEHAEVRPPGGKTSSTRSNRKGRRRRSTSEGSWRAKPRPGPSRRTSSRTTRK